MLVEISTVPEQRRTIKHPRYAAAPRAPPFICAAAISATFYMATPPIPPAAIDRQGLVQRVFRARSLESGNLVAVKVIEGVRDEDLGEDVRGVKWRRSRAARRHSCCIITRASSRQAAFGSSPNCASTRIACRRRDAAMGKPLDEPALAAVLAAALSALHYLHHEQKTLHRDVKAANLLLTDTGDVKLADFGVSVSLTRTLERRSTAIGSPYWMAPELIQEANTNALPICGAWASRRLSSRSSIRLYGR